MGWSRRRVSLPAGAARLKEKTMRVEAVSRLSRHVGSIPLGSFRINDGTEATYVLPACPDSNPKKKFKSAKNSGGSASKSNGDTVSMLSLYRQTLEVRNYNPRTSQRIVQYVNRFLASNGGR